MIKSIYTLILISAILLFANISNVFADSYYYCYCSNADGTESNYSVATCDGDVCKNYCPIDQTGFSSFKRCEVVSSSNDATGMGQGTNRGTNPSPSPSAPVKLTNPLTGNTESKPIPVLLGNIINYAMGIIGSLALVMFIFGGVTWMLSAGNQERVTKGKNIIIWATMGLAIIFTAYALVRFVIETLGKSGGS